MNIPWKILNLALFFVACKDIQTHSESKVEPVSPVSVPEVRYEYVAELVTETYPGYYDPESYKAFITQCIASIKKVPGVHSRSIRNADGRLAFNATASGMKNAQTLKVDNELCFKKIYRDSVSRN